MGLKQSLSSFDSDKNLVIFVNYRGGSIEKYFFESISTVVFDHCLASLGLTVINPCYLTPFLGIFLNVLGLNCPLTTVQTHLEAFLTAKGNYSIH